jgi:hypothetical protein
MDQEGRNGRAKEEEGYMKITVPIEVELDIRVYTKDYSMQLPEVTTEKGYPRISIRKKKTIKIKSYSRKKRKRNYVHSDKFLKKHTEQKGVLPENTNKTHVERAVEYAQEHNLSFVTAHKKLFFYPPSGDQQRHARKIMPEYKEVTLHNKGNEMVQRTEKIATYAQEKGITLNEAAKKLFNRQAYGYELEIAKEKFNYMRPKKSSPENHEYSELVEHYTTKTATSNLKKAVEYAKENKCSFEMAYRKLFKFSPRNDQLNDARKLMDNIEITKEEKLTLKNKRKWKYQKENDKMEEWAVRPQAKICTFCQVREATQGDSCEECHDAFEQGGIK